MSEPGTAAPAAPQLAAVVFTDVVGYSARMQDDEARTIRAVQADLQAMQASCVRLGGQCLNTMGDGMMLSFPSASDAVRFALDVQDAFRERNERCPASEALEHRIGVHLGDMFRLDSGQLTGDGVNIAARLESVAPPGGVCVSQTVYDIVKGKIAMKASFAGKRSLKNIAEPIAVWHLFPGTGTLPPKRIAPRRRVVVAGAAASLVAAGSAALWWKWPSLVRTAAEGKTLAVLPFANLSDDKDASYFADGVHEDLLTQLALLRELKVVSRTSVMEYRGQAKNIRQIASELGVAALVEGSVRRAGNMIRVTAQLIDAAADRHLWAHQYDRELKDIFSVQSELATEIARALQVSLTSSDRKRLARMPTHSMEAYDLYLRHRALAGAAFGWRRIAGGHAERLALIQKAVAIDSSFAQAWSALAAEHARAFGSGVDWSGQRQELVQAALGRGLALASDDPVVRLDEGFAARWALHDLTRAARAYESVLESAPNHADALYGLGMVQGELGNAPRMVALLDRAEKTDPRNLPVLRALAGVHSDYRRYDQSLAYRKRLLGIRPDDPVLQSTYCLVDFWRTGSWQAYEDWQKRAGDSGASPALAGIGIELRRAIGRRDFAGAMRLLEKEATEADASASGPLYNRQMASVTAAAAGQVASARRLATDLLATIDAQLSRVAKVDEILMSKSVAHAVLGQRAEAFSAYEQAVAAAQRSGDRRWISIVRRSVIEIHALLGDRDEAVAELTKQSRLPGFFIHEQNVTASLASIFDAPRFHALLNDAASNAPLPFEVGYDGQKST